MRKEIDSYGTIYYYNDLNQFHREDGPAIEYADGTKYWYRNGQLIEKMVLLLSMLMEINVGIFEANILTAKPTKSFSN